MEDTGKQSLTKGDILVSKNLTKAQAAFLAYCKDFAWGKLEVTVKNGEPVMVTPIRQDVKLD